jgi:hypothetical protein
MNPDREMAPFYTDPLHEELDALETSVEQFLDPNTTSPPWLDPGPDALGQMLGQAEASIEWTTVPPLRPFGEPEPPPIQPGPPAPTVYGSFGPTSPASQEPRERPWGTIEPPIAARPFFAPEGLSREPYRPHPGSNPGALGRSSITTRWCPEKNREVEESTCYECPLWEDHGAGFEECLHDRKQEKQNQEEGEDET